MLVDKWVGNTLPLPYHWARHLLQCGFSVTSSRTAWQSWMLISRSEISIKNTKDTKMSFFNLEKMFCTLLMLPSCPPLSCRWEAVPVHMGELWLAFRPIGWAHQTLPETYWSQTLQMHRLQPLLLALRPPGPAHEAPPELTQTQTCIYKHTHNPTQIQQYPYTWT